MIPFRDFRLGIRLLACMFAEANPPRRLRRRSRIRVWKRLRPAVRSGLFLSTVVLFSLEADGAGARTVVIYPSSIASLSPGDTSADAGEVSPLSGPPESQRGETGSVHKDLKHGWFWYEDREVSEKPEELTETSPPPVARYSREELLMMHPDELKAHLEAALKQAVWKPTLTNVRDYYEVQDVVRRKALAFANVSTALMRENPGESWDANVGPLAGRERYRERLEDIERTLAAAQNDFALVYFFGEGCGYCLRQEEILSVLEADYGWRVRPVEIEENPALAERFGVERVPYLLLVSRRTGKHIPVAFGVVALDTLTRNIYQGIRYLEGRVTPEQFNLYGPDEGGSMDPLGAPRFRVDGEEP